MRAGQRCGPRGDLLAAVWLLARSGLAALCFAAAPIGAALAQTAAPAGILAPGNAAVTGFSEAHPPASVPPGTDPDDKTFIDLKGPSLRVIDLQNMGGPPQAQLVRAPKPYTATAAQIGQVFAVALDDASPPNIYVAATSAYGRPIMVGPDRATEGAPGATFMPGLFGPPPGGPGSIWKIDRLTGVVSLFANVTFNGADNPGPALGGLAFDLASRSLFVADRGTGMIHRFALDGTEQGVYDHGAQGRPAAGLPAVAYDPAKRLDITNPQFNTEDWKTWGYAPAERLVFGLAVRDGRLYYAVKDQLQIWSVSIAAGAFGADARIEINVPPGDGDTEMSKILFDDQGRMVLAERPVPFGDYGFEALTQEGIGRVLRYARRPDGKWQPIPDEYAIGFPLQLRNGNGGVAIGYDYTPNGLIDRSKCGGYLWSTGEELRVSHDPALAAQLAAGGPADVNGLQGNGIELVRPQNVPPLRTYFIDYDDMYDDAASRGHMGDVAIYRVCGPRVGIPGLPAIGIPLLPPPLLCVPGTTQQPGYQCCPDGTSMNASGQCVSWCPPGIDPNGSTSGIPNRQLCAHGFDPTTVDSNNPQNLRCIGGAKPIATGGGGTYGCLDYSLAYNPPVCASGYTKGTVGQGGVPGLPPTGNPVLDNEQVCVPNQQQQNCATGQQVGFDGQCHVLCPNGGTAYPLTPPTAGQCCPDGSIVTSTGYCCPPGATIDPTTGKCGPPQPCVPTPVPIPGQPNLCCPPGATLEGRAGGPPNYCCVPGAGGFPNARSHNPVRRPNPASPASAVRPASRPSSKAASLPAARRPSASCSRRSPVRHRRATAARPARCRIR